MSIHDAGPDPVPARVNCPLTNAQHLARILTRKFFSLHGDQRYGCAGHMEGLICIISQLPTVCRTHLAQQREGLAAMRPNAAHKFADIIALKLAVLQKR